MIPSTLGSLRSFRIIAIFLLVPVFLNSQTHIDSIAQVLKSTTIDSVKGKLYLELAQQYAQLDVDKMIDYIDSAQMITSYVKTSNGKANIDHSYGKAYKMKNQLDTALIFFDRALAHYLAINDSVGFTNTYYQLGDIERRRSNLDQATKYFLRCKDLYQALGNNIMVAGCLNALGIVYKNMNLDDQAIEYYTKAKMAFEENGSTFNIAISALNIGNLHNKNKRFEEAIKSFETVLTISDDMDDVKMRAYALSSMGSSYYNQNQLKKALELYEESYEIRKENSNPDEICNSLINLGKVAEECNNDNKAIIYYNRALVISKENDLLKAQNSSSNGLAICYRKKGEHKKAYDYLSEAKVLSDSLNDLATRQTVIDINTKYETEKKESEIGLLNSENEIAILELSDARKNLYILLGVLGISFFFMYQFYRFNRKIKSQNQQIKDALDEKEILLREIHHRVKNNLQVISSLLSLQGRYTDDPSIETALREGKNRVKSMSLIHQNLYQKENLTGVNVKEYFTKLFESLFGSYNIHPDKIKLSLDISDISLDVDSIVPIGLMVNEMVSNALKHAFPNNQEGTIYISLDENENGLELIVQDNGVGFESAPSTDESQSFGYTLIETFKDKLNADMNLTTTNGTTINMLIRNYSKVA